MAQHCSTCGRELRDSDVYCASCGAIPAKTAPHQAEPERWELCEISWSKKKGLFAKWYFWARNVETGEPVVKGTKEFVPASTTYGASQPSEGSRGTVPAFDEVVDLLRKVGWEPVSAPSSSGGTGRWNPQFRRLV